MPISQSKDFGGALVGGNERVTGFACMGRTRCVPSCQRDGTVKDTLLQLLFGEGDWLGSGRSFVFCKARTKLEV